MPKPIGASQVCLCGGTELAFLEVLTVNLRGQHSPHVSTRTVVFLISGPMGVQVLVVCLGGQTPLVCPGLTVTHCAEVWVEALVKAALAAHCCLPCALTQVPPSAPWCPPSSPSVLPTPQVSSPEGCFTQGWISVIGENSFVYSLVQRIGECKKKEMESMC